MFAPAYRGNGRYEPDQVSGRVMTVTKHQPPNLKVCFGTEIKPYAYIVHECRLLPTCPQCGNWHHAKPGDLCQDCTDGLRTEADID